MLWRAGTKPVVLTAKGPVAVAPDGKRWVTAERGLLRWEGHEATGLSTWLPHRATPQHAVLSRDGKCVAVLAGNACLRVFEAATGRELASRRQFRGKLLGAVGATELAVWAPPTGASPVLQMWSFPDLIAGHTKPTHEWQLPSLAGLSLEASPHFSPDGRWFVHGELAFDRHGDAAVWQLPREPFQRFAVSNDGLRVLRLTPQHGRRHPLALESLAANGQALQQCEMAAVQDVRLSPDCRSVLLRTSDDVLVWSTDQLELQWRLGVATVDASWLDNQHILAVSANDAAVTVWDCQGITRSVALPWPVRRVAATADGTRAIAVLDDRVTLLGVMH